MPIILQRTGPDRTINALTLVNRILRGRNLGSVLTIEGTDVPEEAQEALWCANEITEELWVKAGMRYSHAEWYADMEPGTQFYDGPTSFQEMDAAPRVDERQLTMETMDNLWRQSSNTDREGCPAKYVFRNDQIGLYPVPNEEYLSARYVYDSGVWYVCIKGTESLDEADATAPASDTTHWAATAVVPGETSDFPWNAGETYLSGRVRMLFRAGLTIMAANSDEPLLPAKFYYGIVRGARWLLSQQFNEPVAVQDRLESRYQQWLHLMKMTAPYHETCTIQDANPL